MQRVTNPMAGRANRVYTVRRIIVSSVAASWMLVGLALFFATGAADTALAAIAVVPLVAVTIYWTARPVR